MTSNDHLPTAPLNRRWSRRVDELAIHEYGMSGLVLMENAGNGVARFIRELLPAGPVCIACGGGNNGGDGFVIARHLDAQGIPVRVGIWADVERLPPDAAANLALLRRCDVSLVEFGNQAEAADLVEWLRQSECVVDCLLGTGARGEPRQPLPLVLVALNACPGVRVAVDLPSGLDCDTGQPAEACFRATHTCTLVAPKPGFAAPEAAGHLGQVSVIDIGVPRTLLEQVFREAAGATDDAAPRTTDPESKDPR